MADLRSRKKFKKVTGDKVRLAKLAELEKVNIVLDKRAKVSSKMFEKVDKLRQQLGID